MDPELVRMIQAALGMGVDPFAPSFGPMDGMGSNMLVQPPMDRRGNVEPFDLANQKKAFDTIQDWASLSSDPAIIGGVFGAYPGAGFGPEAFEPVPVYTPVETPGLDYATQIAGRGGVEALIAQHILEGGSASEAEAAIRQAYTDRDDPNNKIVMASMPMYTPSGVGGLGPGTDQPDWNYIKTVARDMEKGVLTDPRPDVDPTTGQFMIDPETGRPATVTYDESEASRWFRETGTPTPYERYGQEELMTPEQVQQEVDLEGRVFDRNDQIRQLGRQLAAEQERVDAERQMYDRFLQQQAQEALGERRAGVRQPQREVGPEQPPYLMGTGADRDVMGYGDMAQGRTLESGLTELTRQFRDRNRTPSTVTPSGGGRSGAPTSRGDGQRRPSRPRTSLAARQYRQEQNRMTREGKQDQIDRVWAQRAQRERQRVLDQMHSAGRTPYNDTMMARRMAAYAAGFGAPY